MIFEMNERIMIASFGRRKEEIDDKLDTEGEVVNVEAFLLDADEEKEDWEETTTFELSKNSVLHSLRYLFFYIN